MGGIDTQFAEDVLSVGGDGVNTREAFVGNLLRRLALGDGTHNLRLCLRQDSRAFLVFLLLADDDLQRPLTDVAVVAVDGIEGVADIFERAILEDDAELVGRIDHTAQELRRQLVADENPL